MHIYKGVDIATAREVQKVENCTRNHLYNRFNTRKHEMIEGIDYFHLTREEVKAFPYRAKTGGYIHGMLLYTAEGYKKLFKENFEQSRFDALFPEAKETRKKEVGKGKKTKEKPKNLEELVQQDKVIVTVPETKDVSEKILDILIADRETYMHMIDQQNAQISSLINLITNIFNAPARREETLEPELVAIDNGKTENPKESIQNWYDRINNLVDEIKAKTNKDANVVLSNAYKKLDSQYGVCIEQYKRDFGNIIHKKPTTLSTIYWMENEKNPTTKGLLEDILISMLESK